MNVQVPIFLSLKSFLEFVQDQKMKDVQNILILAGDQLYRMDYMKFVQVLALSYVNFIQYYSWIAYEKFIQLKNNYLEGLKI